MRRELRVGTWGQETSRMPVASLWVASPNEISSFISSSEGRRQDISKSLRGSWSSSFVGGFKERKPALKFFFGLSSHKTGNYGSFRVLSSLVVNPPEDMALSSEKRIYDIVLRQASLVKETVGPKRVIGSGEERIVNGNFGLLDEAYERCGEICAEYAKTFYLGWLSLLPLNQFLLIALVRRTTLTSIVNDSFITKLTGILNSGTLLMTPERRRAIWAIYGNHSSSISLLAFAPKLYKMMILINIVIFRSLVSPGQLNGLQTFH